MNNLKAIREEKGLTQQQLADMIGTSKPYISQLESGKRNIKQIQSGTMQRLCSALECKLEDLTTKFVPKYEDGLLIVDCIWYDPRFTNPICQIGDEYFLIGTPVQITSAGEDPVKTLRPFMSKPATTAKEVLQPYYPLMYKCVKRSGYDIELLRAITTEEFDELKKELNLTEEDISTEFTDVKGRCFGERYWKEYTSVQIKVKGNAIYLEHRLLDKGIEASSVAPYRVNIRVK